MITKAKPVVETGDQREWFEAWFDSPYYHLLYQDRDRKEAESFIDKLIARINPPTEARILDVACGRGRHSIYLNKKGFDVTGFDLSVENIGFVSQFENEKLSFYLHDMREVFRSNYFDIVLNLFSSFGYFEKVHDNLRSLEAIGIALKPTGYFVFDYFNAHKLVEHCEEESEKVVNDIRFIIKKRIDGGFVRKTILFSDRERDYRYEERLMLATKEEFEKYFKDAGLTIHESFGNYNLDPFNKDESDRLILIAGKSQKNS